MIANVLKIAVIFIILVVVPATFLFDADGRIHLNKLSDENLADTLFVYYLILAIMVLLFSLLKKIISFFYKK